MSLFISLFSILISEYILILTCHSYQWSSNRNKYEWKQKEIHFKITSSLPKYGSDTNDSDNIVKTRMHSSRMPTIRCSGRGGYPSMHWAGECVYPSMHWAGGCLPRRVSAPVHSRIHPRKQNPWHTLVKTFTFPQLRLRTVIKISKAKYIWWLHFLFRGRRCPRNCSNCRHHQYLWNATRGSPTS